MIIAAELMLPFRGRFFEAPRWHADRWWVSDMTTRSVSSFAPNGEPRVEFELQDRPSGLGWLPDGSLIVVSMDELLLLRRQEGRAAREVYVDLSSLCGEVSGHLNDLVIDDAGNIYVGFDPHFSEHGFQSEFGSIIHVDPRGKAIIAARGLHFPNGMVLAHGGTELIAAETGSPRLTRFRIEPSGALIDRSVWANVIAPGEPLVSWGDTGLDGCTIDAQGCVWVANSGTSDCLRVLPGGEISDIVRLPARYRAIACALGGTEGRTLLVCGFDLGPDNDLDSSVSDLFEVGVAVGIPTQRSK